jgi:hypothetical protein
VTQHLVFLCFGLDILQTICQVEIAKTVASSPLGSGNVEGSTFKGGPQV